MTIRKVASLLPARASWKAALLWRPGFTLVVALALLVSGGGARVVQATPLPSPEAVEGVVVDGTAGAAVPSGLVVRLERRDAAGRRSSLATATVDERGTFSFPAPPLAEGTSAVVRAEYAGVGYEASVVRAADGTIAPVRLTIYEPTDSDATLQIAAANWVFEGIDTQNQQVLILETLEVVNAGDRTYVGDHRGDPGSDVPGVLPRSIRLLLPSGASGFIPQDGLDPLRLLPVAGGFVDTAPVPPGSHQIAYTYIIAYADGGAELRKALPYPTKTLRVLVPNAGLEIRTDRLHAAGTIEIQGRPYLVLGAEDVPANTNVTVDVLGLPSSPTGRLDPGAIQLFGLSVLVLAVGVALYLGLRPRSHERDDPATERRALLLALARLDDSLAAGRINPERYQAERARQKRRLIDLALGGSVTADGGEGR